MPNTEKAPLILEKALAEWRKQQTLKREKISISKFADFLGYSQQAVNFWLNRDRPVSEEAIIRIAPKLAELLGTEIYTILELPEPKINLKYLESIWGNLSPKDREKLRKEAEKIVKKKNG